MNYKFFSKDQGKWITAAPEAWRWEAIYEDGTILKQFGNDGIYHQFGEIDQSKLAVFRMVAAKKAQTYTLIFSDPEMKLIHFYRNTVLNAGGDSEKHVRTYCFGYERRIGEKVHKVIIMLTPGNGVIITEDPDLAALK